MLLSVVREVDGSMTEPDNQGISQFHPGCRVRIIEGTFVGMQGTIISPEIVSREGGRYYRLLISVFGADVPIEQRAEQLVFVPAT
jgi:transcription antitermination factor NusG